MPINVLRGIHAWKRRGIHAWKRGGIHAVKGVWNRFCNLAAVSDLWLRPLTKPQNAGQHLWPPLERREGRLGAVTMDGKAAARRRGRSVI